MIYRVEVTVSRSEFTNYVSEQTNWGTNEAKNTILLKSNSTTDNRGVAVGLLRNFVMKNFTHMIDVNLYLDEKNEFWMLFPPTHMQRKFKVDVEFKDKKHLNRLKLKYPDAINEVLENGVLLSE